jgi:hypothetical protein
MRLTALSSSAVAYAWDPTGLTRASFAPRRPTGDEDAEPPARRQPVADRQVKTTRAASDRVPPDTPTTAVRAE